MAEMTYNIMDASNSQMDYLTIENELWINNDGSFEKLYKFESIFKNFNGDNIEFPTTLYDKDGAMVQVAITSVRSNDGDDLNFVTKLNVRPDGKTTLEQEGGASIVLTRTDDGKKNDRQLTWSILEKTNAIVTHSTSFG